jgi:pyrroline-5-carboxylate reductase
MKISDYRLGFVGFGHMAKAIFRAIDQSRLIPRSQILFMRRDRDKMRDDEREFGITSTSLEHLAKTSDLLLLCVRPAQAHLVLKDLAQTEAPSKMILSVLAGVKLNFLQTYLGQHSQVLRVMPNIASEVGEGMSVFSHLPHPSIEFRSLTKLLFSSLGQVIEAPEDLMDISCGIAGSGPGFVFRLIEAMARTGEKHGLSYEQALKMSAQTFLGAAQLILKGKSPERLIEQIATPNGTTEAGFQVMQSNEIEKCLAEAVEASMRRSREISQSFT